MTTSKIETSKGIVEYILIGNGRPVLIVVGGHSHCKESIFHKGLDQDKFCFVTPSRPGYGLTPLTDENKTPKGTSDLFIALLGTENRKDKCSGHICRWVDSFRNCRELS